MEIVLLVAALVLLDVLAHRFGHDSRAGIGEDERHRLTKVVD
jgi:hypothetical protein